jgi:hypothetical protein
MAHPLDGSRAKLSRARETIQTIRQEVATFENPETPPFRVVRENVGTEFVFRVFGDSSIPLRLSVLAGEVVHHLRSSLDHVIYALVVKNHHKPNNFHQFPICETPRQFKDACKRGQIDGVSFTAKKLIEEVQPYTSPTPDDTILNVVAQLDNADKHRLLVLIQSAAYIGKRLTFGADPNIAVPADRNGPPPAIVGVSLPGPQAVTPEGSVVFSIQLAGPAPEFTVKGEVIPVVAIEKCGRSKNASLVSMLELFEKGVTHTVESFSGEF